METTHKENMTVLRREIDRNRLLERLEWQKKLQNVYALSPTQAAIELNRKCRHCGQYLIPTAQPDEWRGGFHWIWPDEHDCEAARIAKEQEEAQKVINQMTLEQKEHCKRLHDAGLIGWLAEATFATFSAREDWPGAEEAWQQVMIYAKTVEAAQACEKPFLVLYGQVGGGKSHLAASVVRFFLDKGHRPCYFRVWPDYLKRITATFGRRRDDDSEHEAEEDIINELQMGKIVVIDDLDKRRPTDWVKEILFPVLNHRYNAGLPTILTLNYGPADVDPVAPGRLALEAYLGRAGLDRVIGAAFDIIEFNGPSYRSGLDYQ